MYFDDTTADVQQDSSFGYYDRDDSIELRILDCWGGLFETEHLSGLETGEHTWVWLPCLMCGWNCTTIPVTPQQSPLCHACNMDVGYEPWDGMRDVF